MAANSRASLDGMHRASGPLGLPLRSVPVGLSLFLVAIWLFSGRLLEIFFARTFELRDPLLIETIRAGKKLSFPFRPFRQICLFQRIAQEFEKRPLAPFVVARSTV